MCIVSNVFDYGSTVPMPHVPSYPPPVQPQPTQGSPWTREAFEDFKKLIKLAEKLDEKLNQPDCEDPEKAAWMREVERRLKALEDGAEKGAR